MENKKIIIIALLIIILAIIGIAIIFGSGVTQEKTYEQYNFSATCSIELPTWIHFNNGAGDLNSNSNIMGSNVESTTKALFGNNEVMQITYSHSTVDGANVGADLNDNIEIEQNGKKVFTRMVMNEATGESVSVMGENEEVVNYIADHVKFNGTATNKTNTTSEATSTGSSEPASTNNNSGDGIQRDGRYDGRFDNRVDLNDAYNQGFSDGQQVASLDEESSSNHGSNSERGDVETTTDSSFEPTDD